MDMAEPFLVTYWWSCVHFSHFLPNSSWPEFIHLGFLVCRGWCCISFYLHCLGRNFSSDNRELIRVSSRFAPGPGFNTLVLPAMEHGSVPFSWLPMHQPPATTMLGRLCRSCLSISSSTGSSPTNFLANGALLSTILCISLTLRWWGCCLGGLSHDMKWRSLFTVVFWNCCALQTTVWKYPSGEDMKFA